VAALSLVWGQAVAGMLCVVGALHLPRWAHTALYVSVGWTALVWVPSLAAALPLAAVLTIIGGGLIYTFGALVYALRRPDPVPRVFGFHEVFHALVIGGSAAF